MKYINKKKETLCPLCYSKKSILLWSISSSEAAQHFILREKNQKIFTQLLLHIENLWGKKQCEVIKCLGCNFIFSNYWFFINLKESNIGYVPI